MMNNTSCSLLYCDSWNVYRGLLEFWWTMRWKETTWPTRNSATEEKHENCFRLAEFEVTALRIQVWNTFVTPTVQDISNGEDDNDYGGDEDNNKIPK
jgi:hypothetical protein